MMRFSVSLPAVALAALLLPVAVRGQATLAGSVQPPRIHPNDNREPAGALEDGVLTLRLDAREGMWHPHGFDREGIRVTIEIVNSALVDRSKGHGHDAQHMMGMLVVGIRVLPSGPAEDRPAESRRLRLLIRSRPEVYGKYPGYAYVLGGSAEAE